jgi:hypothetical protein
LNRIPPPPFSIEVNRNPASPPAWRGHLRRRGGAIAAGDPSRAQTDLKQKLQVHRLLLLFHAPVLCCGRRRFDDTARPLPPLLRNTGAFPARAIPSSPPKHRHHFFSI